ncbi:MAG TPA: right-handed parallel beta-helix repeat-containing protein, partial [Segetibacter sp.]
MKFLFFVISLFALKYSFATTYYFSDITGDDNYSAIQAQNPLTPWKTINKLNAFRNLKPGDSVLFKKGETFYGNIKVQANGEVNEPITYSSYGSGPNPVISGFTSINGWTFSNGNTYYANVSATMIQGVTLDGEVKGMGRYPNRGYLTYTGHPNNTSISGTSVSGLPTTYVGGEVVIKKQRYILDRHKITAQSGNTISFNTTNFYGNNSTYLPDDGNGYFIQGHLSTLDQEGEWCYDAAAQRLYMHFGSKTPIGRTVKVSTVNQLLTLNSSAYITFNNIDFEGGSFGVVNSGSNNITFNNCNWRQQATAIYGADCTNMQVNGGSISDCPNNGIFIEANGTNTSINGTTVTRCGTIAGLGESGDGKYNGILINGDGTTISNCTVKNIGFNAIYFDGNNVLVEHNFVDSFCTVKDDGGGIYTFTNDGVTRSNRIIRNNIILHAIGCPDGAQYDG